MDVQQLFTNLRKEAECPLCLETVSDPKTLPCLHSFCLKCLDKLAGFARRQLQTTVKCPVCLTAFPIPEGDSFNNLPASFHLNRLVDVLALKDGSAQAQRCSCCDENNTATCYCFVCQNFLCIACFEAHQRLKGTRGHRNVVIDKLQAQDVEELIHRPVMCSQQYHENQPLEFYCKECKVAICHKCSVVSHNRHTMTDTREVAQVQKVKMADAMAKVKEKTVIYENKIRKQTELMDKNKNTILSAEKKMTEAVEEFICDLRKHETTMKAKFAQILEEQQKIHATRLESFELVVAQLKSCIERGESILERDISVEVLQTNQTIIGRCEELLKAKKPKIYRPTHVHYMVEGKANILDRLVVSNTDPSLSSVEEHSRKEVKENAETNFTIVTRDSHGLQCYYEDDKINVNISTPAGDQLQTEIKDMKDGKYTVKYTTRCAGQHRVEIRVNGQPLTVSPWNVQVIPHQYQFAFHFGTTGVVQGTFMEPFGIAVSDITGTIAVADSKNKRVQMFSSDGNFLREIAVNNKPFSLAFTETGDLLVCIPEGGNPLSLFTEDGQFIRHINGDHLEKPRHLYVKSDGRIIICDLTGNKIKVVSPDGKDLLLSFSAPGCDAYPCAAVHHQDKFFVSYPGADCVKVFNNTGLYLYDIGCRGTGEGQFNEPSGLVIDKFHNLIVCDAKNRRLQLFTLDGEFVSNIAGSYFEDNCLLYYCAVSITGHLFVTDEAKNHVYVFKDILGHFLGQF